MKILIFFSRVAFICNLFFVVAIVLRFLDVSKNKVTGELIVKSKFLTSTVVVLGYSAVVLNAILVIAYVSLAALANHRGLPPLWLVLTNIVFFFIQVYYFFF